MTFSCSASTAMGESTEDIVKEKKFLWRWRNKMTVKKSNSISPLVEDEEVQEQETEPEIKKSGNSKKFCVLFRITKGLQFPHFAVILTNLILSVPVLLLIFAYFARAIMEDMEERPEPVQRSGNDTYGSEDANSKPDYGFPSRLYCESHITLSLFVEFFAQFVYTCGSVLLLIGALKRNKRFCYCFVVSGILSFFLAALIRTGQFALCDKNQVTRIKGRVHPYLPPLFKLTFIWLVCQLFWYWLILSLVAALLNWMHEEEEEDERMTPIPSTSSSSSSTPPTPPPSKKKSEEKKASGGGGNDDDEDNNKKL